LETYRYCKSLPIGDRLTAVWDASEAAYAFAAAFKGAPLNDGRGSERLLRAFNAHAVKYLVVGATPSVFMLNRGQRRTSICLFNHSGEQRSSFRALASLAPPGRAGAGRFMDGTIFQIGQPPARVDILQQMTASASMKAWVTRIEGRVDEKFPGRHFQKRISIRNKVQRRERTSLT